MSSASAAVTEAKSVLWVYAWITTIILKSKWQVKVRASYLRAKKYIQFWLVGVHHPRLNMYTLYDGILKTFRTKEHSWYKCQLSENAITLLPHSCREGGGRTGAIHFYGMSLQRRVYRI